MIIMIYKSKNEILNVNYKFLNQKPYSYLLCEFISTGSCFPDAPPNPDKGGYRQKKRLKTKKVKKTKKKLKTKKQKY